ncbi:MAG: NUDIX hydrolase [Rhodospirillales bacterium]|nr:NUDIX hydrolase [Rhodospirillales bacterium]
MSRLYPRAPLVGVAAVVFENESVLLVRRGKAPRRNEWGLPGGLQKVGETIFAAACREVLEETALHIEVLCLADVVDLIERESENGRVRYHYTLVDFVGCRASGSICAGSDAVDAAWFELRNLDRCALWAETRRVIGLAYEKWLAAGSP